MKPTTLLLAMSLLAPSASLAGDQWHVYFGCYTNAKTGSKGIQVSKFNSATGALTDPVLAAETASPSFLALHPEGKFLYCVGETPKASAQGGPVSAYAINKADGTLKLINQVDSRGDGPCHISLDATGRMAMVANYGGGSVASYHIKDDGALAGPVTFIQHEGSSVNPQRQKGPHAHSFNRSPDNRYGFVCDLGLDKVITYQMDPATGAIKPAAETKLPPGTGPRHFAFHPSGKFAFVNGEMFMNVSTLTYAADSGKFEVASVASTLPPEDQGKTGYSTAETVAHPNGKNVYVSNRTHDTIAVFSCDPATGKLTLIQNAPAGGKIPRNFNLDPTGRWMIVGHQDSNTAVVLKVDPETGKLSPTDTKINVGGAVCVRFLAAD